jgi:glycosyltransferase involved in cell wall biosynthesis
MHDGARIRLTCRATVIIPALDEAGVIGALVSRVPPDLVDEVVVVDNGSSDDTAREAAKAGARVVSEPRRGYGAACWAGVSALDATATVAVFLDGDGSQRPEELARVLAPLEADRADLVLGARAPSADHPWHARLGTRGVAAFVSWRYQQRITDVPPFRAIRVPLLRRLHMRDRAFGWPVEMVVKAAALGARIVEVPVSHEPRMAGRSKVSGSLVGSARAAYGFLRAALRAASDVR